MKTNPNIKDFFEGYSKKLQEVLQESDWSPIEQLANDMQKCWNEGRHIFLCGNGGSAGNAIHLANDFIYGIAKKTGGGIKAISLSDNSAVITCLANDIGYDYIYSEQLAVQAEKGDLLIVLSGSGNSLNILHAVEQAKKMQVKSFAVLGYSGGKCKEIVDVPIHFPVNDMQIAEDLQIIVGHMLMQWLYKNRPKR
ncbi:MAG: SIS domain-containing protein [Methylophilaceae bacterium]|jgi:D-sedoheptulose 7-phosphate isomerase|nr:SIS domain-containing protein [Methylophilaceae bacterium]